jgi:hypothetical protein
VSRQHTYNGQTFQGTDRETFLRERAEALRLEGKSPQSIYHRLCADNEDCCEPPVEEAYLHSLAGDDVQPSYRYGAIDSATFAARARLNKPQWLLRRLLVKGQPAFIGGPRKVLKTSFIVDLALSLASGKPFLGKFEVYKPCRTAVISGESGEWAIYETAERVCAAKGIDLDRALVRWDFTLPQLADPTQLAELQRGLKEDCAEVCLLDPLYLSLLAGQNNLDARNLFDMGPLLSAASRACLEVGCTPAFVHHSPKHFATGVMELDDLAFAGCAEFARQWLLISRRKEFVPGSGWCPATIERRYSSP